MKKAKTKKKEGKAGWRRYVDTIMMALGFGIMLGVSVPGFRDSIGGGVNYVLGPLAVLPIHIIILMMAVITGIATSFIQKYTMDWESMKKNQEKSKQIQGKMRELNKELKDAYKDENKYKMKRLEQKRAEIMKEQSEMMKEQFAGGMMMQMFKPMFYTIPIVLPIFIWLRYLVYFAPNPCRAEIMFLPLLGAGTLGSSSTNVFGFIPYWFFWYMLCSFPLTQLIRKALKM
jgi:uncharacterized membrane protein (DUF106 family)